MMVFDGLGGPQDLEEARRLYGLAAAYAAAQGDAEAQFTLGFMHNEGQGGPQDSPEARRLYGLAAAQGLAFAQFNLGCMHREGQGGRKDVLEARRLFGLAAAQGHKRALIEAERLADAMAEVLLAEEEAEAFLPRPGGRRHRLACLDWAAWSC